MRNIALWIKATLFVWIAVISSVLFAEGKSEGIYTNYNYGFTVKYNKTRTLLKNNPPSPDDGIQLVLSDDKNNRISVIGSTNAEFVECDIASVKEHVKRLESQIGAVQFISVCKTNYANKQAIRLIYLVSTKDGKKFVGDRVFLFRGKSNKYAGNLIAVSLFVEADSYAGSLSEFESILASLRVKE